MKVIISGAGIGGLTAALCFLQHGAEVAVLERAPALGEVGAGIQVPPNAMKVFQALGLDDALARYCLSPRSIGSAHGTIGVGTVQHSGGKCRH